MTQHSPINLSVDNLNEIELSVENLHNITLSVAEYFYTQLLYAIIARSGVGLGADAIFSVISQINAECAAIFGVQAGLVAPSRIVASSGVYLGTTADLEITVMARIIALSSVVLGAQAGISIVSRIIGAAGVSFGGTANVIVPANVQAQSAINPGASGSLIVPTQIIPDASVRLQAELTAVTMAIINGAATIGLAATADLDAGGGGIIDAYRDIALKLAIIKGSFNEIQSSTQDVYSKLIVMSLN